MKEEFKNGSKYFANVQHIVESIKKVNSTTLPSEASEHETLTFNMIKSLCTIIDTQNDILKYIVSHDNKAHISATHDTYAAGQFVWIERNKSFGVIKEIKDTDFINVFILKESQDVTLNKLEITIL